MKERTHLTRIYPSDKEKIKNWTLKISDVQQKRIFSPEVIRRMCNIPKIDNVLLQDAINKRRMKK